MSVMERKIVAKTMPELKTFSHVMGTQVSIETMKLARRMYQISLAFVVIVVTTGVSTTEGALQAGFGFVVLEQLLTYLPARLGGNSLVIVLFCVGALTYTAHPEGILEFQKRRWTLRFDRWVFHTDSSSMGAARPGPAPPLQPDYADGGAGVSSVGPVVTDG